MSVWVDEYNVARKFGILIHTKQRIPNVFARSVYYFYVGEDFKVFVALKFKLNNNKKKKFNDSSCKIL